MGFTMECVFENNLPHRVDDKFSREITEFLVFLLVNFPPILSTINMISLSLPTFLYLLFDKNDD